MRFTVKSPDVRSHAQRRRLSNKCRQLSKKSGLEFILQLLQISSMQCFYVGVKKLQELIFFGEVLIGSRKNQSGVVAIYSSSLYSFSAFVK